MPPQIRMSESQGPPSPRGEAGPTDRGRFRQRQRQQHGEEDDDNDRATRRQYRDFTSRHDDFTRALERHGSNLNSSGWPILAEDLGWSMQEVQSYAFQYLISLLHRPGAPTAGANRTNTPPRRTSTHQLPITMNGSSNIGGSGGPTTLLCGVSGTQEHSQVGAATASVSAATSPILQSTATATNPTSNSELNATAITTMIPATSSIQTNTMPHTFGSNPPIVRRNRRRPQPWSLEESVLFDTLVATYLPVEDPEGYDWEELVAAQLPGRSATEIRRRWHQLLSRRNQNGLR